MPVRHLCSRGGMHQFEVAADDGDMVGGGERAE